MKLENGYQMQTTFLQDFAIANQFGEAAIRDTFSRVLSEWGNNIVFMTELVIVTNLYIWHYYAKGNEPLAKVYDELWRKATDAVWDNPNFTETDHQYFYDITD